MKKVYIAGKVTGLPIAECTMKFGAAQKKLEALGYEVINPLAVVNDYRSPWQQAMRKCIAALVNCDYIYLLPDWYDSTGANLEVQIAKQLGILTMAHYEGKLFIENKTLGGESAD